MQNLTVKSWNVLHIVHELNYVYDNSPVLKKYGNNEAQRLTDICDTIIKELDKNTVMCLQEVPIDLYDLLCKTIPSEYKIFIHVYKRVPRIKHSGITDPYVVKGEALVMIVDKSLVLEKYEHAIVMFDDPGKAAQLVDLQHIAIINVHMVYGAERTDALNKIFKRISGIKKFVIIGDMNMEDGALNHEVQTCGQRDGAIVFTTNTPTRKYMKKTDFGYNYIDHIIVSKNIQMLNLWANNNEDMSDHMLIGCYINY